MIARIEHEPDERWYDFPYTVILKRDAADYGDVEGVAVTKWGARRIAKRALKRGSRPEPRPVLLEEHHG